MRLHGLFGIALFAFASFNATANAQVFWIGGYGPGIYASRLQPNGAMDAPQLVAEQPNPSFFAIHPTLNVIYSVAETARSDAKQGAALAAYQFDNASYARGEFSPLKRISLESVNGDGPCHVTLDREGKWAMVANYSSGSVSLFPIQADGSLQAESHAVSHQGSGPNASRQQGAHAHCAMFDPSNRYVMVADLGIDRVLIYQIDPTKKHLIPGPQPYLDLPPGIGPRHLAFHPSGAFVFIINELAMTMTAASWNAETGQMAIINTESTIPEGKPVPGGSTAEVLVHPSGRFVYGSNRGPNTIALFAIDPNSGRIRRIENFDTLGKIPRNFRISPDGGFLLAENQESNSIFSFRIDTGTGFLKPTGFSISTTKPACIKFLER
jgi:6-phosphogluconolactonase